MQCPVAFATIQSLFSEPLEVGAAPNSKVGWPVMPDGDVDVLSGPLGDIVYLHPLRGRWQQIVHGNAQAGRPFIGVLEDALVFAGAVGWKRLVDVCYDKQTKPLPVRLRGHNYPKQVGPVWAEWVDMYEPVDPEWLKQVFRYRQIQVLSIETQPRREGGTFSRMIFTR